MLKREPAEEEPDNCDPFRYSETTKRPWLSSMLMKSRTSLGEGQEEVEGGECSRCTTRSCLQPSCCCGTETFSASLDVCRGSVFLNHLRVSCEVHFVEVLEGEAVRHWLDGDGVGWGVRWAARSVRPNVKVRLATWDLVENDFCFVVPYLANTFLSVDRSGSDCKSDHGRMREDEI